MTSSGSRVWSAPGPLFGQVREDSSIESQLASQVEARRGFCITSGGCTAFALAQVVRETLISVDVNPAQTALAKLKWQLLSSECEAVIQSAFHGTISKISTVPSFIAEAGHQFATEDWIRKGLHRCGMIDARLDTLRKFAYGLGLSRRSVRETLERDDQNLQEAEFRKDWANWRIRLGMRLAFNRTVFRTVFPTGGLTVPPRLDQLIFTKLKRLVCDFPTQSNPYAWELLQGESCPDPASRPAVLQPRIATRTSAEISFQTGDAASILGRLSDLDFVALSNIGEARGPEFSRNLIFAARNALRPDGLAVTRSILPVVDEFEITRMKRRIDLEKEAERLDRSVICTGFRIWMKSRG